ncbi:MAG TPA: YfhO family protein, partial [Chloroflexota bacterium]|nr:YfhO family protein [Chloroflexota bacterium]
DGEAGMLYPPNLLALRLLDPPTALVALRLTRFYLAGAFTYAYLRAADCARPAALTGGLAFMGSGFMVGQVVHENLASGMVWLPLALSFVERGVRAATPGERYRYAAFAGVALAIQALAVHVQVCVFTVLAVCPYVAWRMLWRSPLKEHPLDRAGAGLVMGLVMGGTAFGLAAVQLLPLLEVAAGSARGHGIGLNAATINSVTPFRLLTVLYPELLRRMDGAPFGRWVDWDVTVYVGLPVVLFAVVAVLLRRDTFTTYFAVLAGTALILSMGRYGPPWVVAVTRDLLGEHGLRSPGRFAFLWSFGVAALAGLGVDWLIRARWPRGAGRVWLGLVGGALAGLGAGVLVSAHTGRVWLVENREAALRWIEQEFMAFDPTVKPKATAMEAYAGLLNALDPGQPAFRVWLGSLIGAYAVFVAWCVLRATPHRRVQRALRPWLGVLVALVVTAPLLAAASRSHPAEPMTAVEPNSLATVFLRDRLAPVGVPEAARPLERVYAGQAVYLGRTDVEPNALLPLGVQEAGGYSSLSSERHMAYAWAAETSAGRMLDVWNARYFVAPNVPQALPSVELASYHPERPLLTGNATNAGATAWFRVPAVLSENVRLIATLRDAWGAKPGAVAAWVAAEDDAGERYVWPVRVGLEIAEATSGDPAMRAERESGLAESPIEPLVVHTGREFAGDGSTYAVRLYYAKLTLPRHARIVRIGVQAVALPNAPHAILRLHGLGAGQPDWEVHNVVWHDRERFTAAFSDNEVRVYRNETALPRAYLVPLAVALPEAEHVKQMAERAFDPERMVLIDAAGMGSAAGEGGPGAPAEGFGRDSWYAPPAEALERAVPAVEATDTEGRMARSAAGVATITRYSGTAVTVGASVVGTQGAWLFLADTYDRAWRAYVDGRPARVHLANAMFRAVPVPPGEHVIELRYESTALERGAAVSVATGLAVLVSAAAGVLGAAVRRRCVQR